VPQGIKNFCKRKYNCFQICDFGDSGYIFKSSDSVLVWNQKTDKIVSLKIPVPIDFISRKYKLSSGFCYKEEFLMYYREGKLYFESHLWKDYSGSGHYHLPDYPYEMVLNLKTGIATTNRMNFPPYLSNKKYSYQFSICRLPHKDSNIVSLTSSGNIFLIKSTVIGGKSKYQKSGYIEPAWNSDKGWPSPDSTW